MQSATRMSFDILGEGGEKRRFLRSVAGETFTGIAVAALSGLVISLFAWSISGDTRIGLVVGVAMACTVICAALVGSLLPLVLKAIGRDPSKASQPFLATAMDVLGLAVYFLVGTALI